MKVAQLPTPLTDQQESLAGVDHSQISCRASLATLGGPGDADEFGIKLKLSFDRLKKAQRGWDSNHHVAQGIAEQPVHSSFLHGVWTSLAFEMFCSGLQQGVSVRLCVSRPQALAVSPLQSIERTHN